MHGVVGNFSQKLSVATCSTLTNNYHNLGIFGCIDFIETFKHGSYYHTL